MSVRQSEAGGLLLLEAHPPEAATAARPPLLFVHGAGHGAWCWENCMEVPPAKGWLARTLGG